MGKESDIREAELRWRKSVLEPFRSKYPEQETVATTASGIPYKSFYTPLDLEEVGFDYLNDSGFPGEMPFLRGIVPNGYRSITPKCHQYAGFGSAAEANNRFKELVDAGATSLSAAIDLPTQLGYDPDEPFVAAEVAKIGVSLPSVTALETLLDGVDLSNLQVFGSTFNSHAPILIGFFLEFCKRRKISPNALILYSQNDILKEYIARGTYIFPPAAGLSVTCDAIEFAAKEYPNWRVNVLCGSHMRGLGADEIQESAFTIANGLAYIDELLSRGMKITEFVNQWSMQLATQMNILGEVARMRATRRVWAKIIHERYGVDDPKVLSLHVGVTSSGVTFTRQQPLNNIIRGTLAVTAALLSGSPSLYSHPYEEGWGIASSQAQKTQLRTAQIPLYETDLSFVSDPLAGSYFIESMTSQAETAIMRYIDEIDRMGGAIKALEKGYQRAEIAKSAHKHQKAVDAEEQIVVGVNKFKEEQEFEVFPTQVSEENQRAAIDALLRSKNARDNSRVQSELDNVKRAAERNENIVPAVNKACAADATVGEICGKLREVWGEFTPEPMVM